MRIESLRPWSGTGSFLLTVLAALLTSSLSGCGEGLPETIKVGGKVTYQGAPAATGTITFHPAKQTDQRLYRPAVGVMVVILGSVLPLLPVLALPLKPALIRWLAAILLVLAAPFGDH